MNRGKQFSQKDFDFGTELESRLCNVDVKSTDYILMRRRTFIKSILITVTF